MPSLRDEITRTFLRLSRKASTGGHARSLAAAGKTLLPPGTELRSYRVIRQLGEGGMGQVYLALDTHLNRKVALKLLPPDLTGNPTFLRRFQQEARAASALNHPNILTIFEFPEISGHHIIVSELVEGQTLRVLLDRNIDLADALDIMLQVASALAAAHTAGVVHRDLKPTNIMVRPDGYVKIIDFGLAKLTQRGGAGGDSEGESRTMPGAVLGTVGYMSPEQARGEDIDARSDIWSFGVILYEMVSGCRPFEGTTDSHVIVAILDDPPRAIPEQDKLPPGLVTVIQRCLTKDKKGRYHSAQDLLVDLQGVQTGLGVPGRRTLPARRKNRFPVFVAAAAVLLLVSSLAVWWWPFEGRWTVLGPRWFEIGTSRRITFGGNVQLATISPDGKHLAYVSASQGVETFHILDLRTNAERQMAATADHYLGLTFSPNSGSLFFVLKDRQKELGRLFSIPVAGIGSEPPSILLEDLDSPISLSPGGDRFAFVRGKTQGTQNVNQILMGLASSPRTVTPVVALTGTEVSKQIAWSPANDWFGIVNYPVRLGEPTRATVSLYSPDGRTLRSFSPKSLRQLRSPLALDGGALLVFAGMPRGAQQSGLVQLFLPTGEFHESGSDIVGLESFSATADSQTLAAVRFDERSSIWSASAADLGSPNKLTSDSEKITSAEWLSDQSLVFPSTRSGNLNLAKLELSGSIVPASQSENCVETDPAVLPNGSSVVYASNCGSEGDDLNLWVVNLADGKRRRLTSGANFDDEPDVSPDGKWVYYTSWSSNSVSIWKVSIDGGMPARVLQSRARTPVLSPDGTKFVCNLRENDGRWVTEIVSSADGIILMRLPQVPIGRTIRWSPDGTALDYVDEDKLSFGIWRQELSGGSARPLLRVAEGTISSFRWNRSGTKLAYIRARDQKDAILFARAPKR